MGYFYVACKECRVNFHWQSSKPQICDRCKPKSETFHKIQGEITEIHKSHHKDKLKELKNQEK
jgi:hypothetical protein